MQFLEGHIRDIQLVVSGFLFAVILYYLFLRPRAMQGLEKGLRGRKDQFIALASHYLLTPITIIQTAVSRLEDDDGSFNASQRKKFYEAISMGQQRLWIIAEQLVLVNQVDFNDLRLHFEVGDLSETVSSAVADMDVFARAKKIVLHFEDHLGDIHQARFDARRMRQAVVAVLDNAIKFSMEEGEVWVRLGLEGNFFTIIIEDHGVGMPPEIIEHVTEKFYRGTEIYHFDYEGMGLGLYIAQAIIAAHQGSLHFESKLKRGTVAVIRFPNV